MSASMTVVIIAFDPRGIQERPMLELAKRPSLEELKNGKILFYNNTKLGFCNYYTVFDRIKEHLREIGCDDSKWVEYTGTVTSSDVKQSPKNGGSNTIPYRCLVVKGLENFLVAGKAISADRWAHQRFLQQTMVTGEAAGTAAALCVKKGITPRQLEDCVGELQDKLRSKGVILDGVH